MRRTRVSFVSRVAVAALVASAGLARAESPQIEHPIDPAHRAALSALQKLDATADYSATVVKRERVDGTLTPHSYSAIKVRHEPFSVYMKFLGPPRIKGREVIYVDGANNGKLIVKEPGLVGRLGPVHLRPDGMLAMKGQRYPITMLGLKNLTKELIAHAESERTIPVPCEVKFFNGAKVAGRDVQRILIRHPERHPEHTFCTAQVFIDKEHQLPIRYEAHEWPRRKGDPPQLIEEYTYLQLKLNPGFTDLDFSVENPAYGFK